jgi:hypothetical protein
MLGSHTNIPVYGTHFTYIQYRCMPATRTGGTRRTCEHSTTHLMNQSSVPGFMLTWPHAGPASWSSMQLAEPLRQDSARAKTFHVLT